MFKATWRSERAVEIQISMQRHSAVLTHTWRRQVGHSKVTSAWRASQLTWCLSLSTHSVQKQRFTLWWRPRLVGWSGAVVGRVGCRVSPIQGRVAGLAVARLGLAVWRGHWSVLVYIHPQFIPKSGWHNHKPFNNLISNSKQISPPGCLECTSL